MAHGAGSQGTARRGQTVSQLSLLCRPAAQAVLCLLLTQTVAHISYPDLESPSQTSQMSVSTSRSKFYQSGSVLTDSVRESALSPSTRVTSRETGDSGPHAAHVTFPTYC